MNSETRPPETARGMSIADGAKYLGIGKRTLWMLLATKEIPFVRIGNRFRRVLRDDLDYFLESHRQSREAA